MESSLLALEILCLGDMGMRVSPTKLERYREKEPAVN